MVYVERLVRLGSIFGLFEVIDANNSIRELVQI